MESTNFVGRTRAFATAIGLLVVFASGSAFAQSICPDCPDITASIAIDQQAKLIDLTIDAFANFDYSGVDTVELELVEDDETVIVQLNFGPGDIEYGIDETEPLPSLIAGDDPVATLVFYDSATQNEVRVPVPIP